MFPHTTLDRRGTRALVLFTALCLPLSGAAAQCFTALVDPYDCGTPNPVTLTTNFPGEYPVLGQLFFLEALGADPNGMSSILVSYDTACLALPAKVTGELLVDPIVQTLGPFSGVTAWSFAIPNIPAFAGLDFTLQTAHTRPGGYDMSNGLKCQLGYFQAEIAVIDVDPPAGMIGGQGFAQVAVTLFNNGNAPVFVPVHVTIGANFGDNVLGPVPPFSSFTGTVSVPVPPTTLGFCGDSHNFTVTACSNLIDCNPSNNCLSTSAPIAVPYFDLKVQIIGAPSSAKVCCSTTWSVRVSNVGNIPSPPTAMLSAINCAPGSKNYQCVIGGIPKYWTIPSLLPQASNTHSVGTYAIPCNAFIQQQYIKAEINYSAGGGDICTDGDNFDQESISIEPWNGFCP